MNRNCALILTGIVAVHVGWVTTLHAQGIPTGTPTGTPTAEDTKKARVTETAFAIPSVESTFPATPNVTPSNIPTPTLTATPLATVVVSTVPTAAASPSPFATVVSTAVATVVATAAAPSPTPTTAAGKPQCSDGLDNDGDGLVDTADSDCKGPIDPKEGAGGLITIQIPQCGDGVDNDSDTRIDLSDPDCSDSVDASEGVPGTGIQCQNIITKNQKDVLNEHAVRLTKIAGRAGKQLLAAARSKKMEAEVRGSLRKVENLRKLVFETTIGYPDITTTCTGLVCSSVNNFTSIERLKGYIARLRNATKRITARRYFKVSGLTQRNDPLVVDAKRTEAQGKAGLAQLSVVQTACAGG